MAMQQEVSGKWKQMIGKVKEKYGQITDNDLTQLDGSVDQLVGLVQEKTGQTRDQVEAFFEECRASYDSMTERVSDYAASATDTLKEGYDHLSEQTKRGYDASVKTMSRHPLESVGTAFGVGMVAGLLIGFAIGGQRERETSWRDRWMR